MRGTRAAAATILAALLAGGCAGVGPGSPSATPPSAGPVPTPVVVASGPGASGLPRTGDADQAAATADAYERALADGDWQAAWDLLSPASRALRGTFPEYAGERSAYFTSVAGRYTLTTPTNDAGALAPWTASAELVAGADLARAFIVEADYPALAGNNSGYAVLLAAPDAGGTWRIWEVR